MNFTNSPYERMMKQVPRPGRNYVQPSRGPVAPMQPKKQGNNSHRIHRDIIITSGQIGPKLR